jgi:hypothetical protein
MVLHRVTLTILDVHLKHTNIRTMKLPRSDRVASIWPSCSKHSFKGAISLTHTLAVIVASLVVVFLA